MTRTHAFVVAVVLVAASCTTPPAAHQGMQLGCAERDSRCGRGGSAIAAAHADKRVLYVVGMDDEAAIAAGDDALVVKSGANRAHLESELAKIDAAHVSSVISFGVAGALRPWLRPGAVVVADEVVDDHKHTFRVDRALTSSSLSKLAKIEVHRATFLGMDSIMVKPSERVHARREFHAGVVDMESHIAAHWAQVHRIPFAVVRVISDASTLEVPDAMLHSINADGSINVASVASSVMSKPDQLPVLVSTSKDYNKALDVLAQCRRALAAH